MPETEYGARALAPDRDEHAPMDTVPDAAPDETGSQVDGQRLVEEDLLVEEISIDGMCGVY